MPKLSEILFGKPERMKSISTLNPGQENLFSQYLAALGGQPSSGAFGQLSDYYSGLLGGNSQDQQALEAPLMRQFQEDIIPGLAEQFAGMGSGALSSSAFTQGAVNAGTDLAERLGALRAQLRQQGAAGLQGLTSGAFNPVKENIFRPQTFGLTGELASGIGKGLGAGITSFFG